MNRLDEKMLLRLLAGELDEVSAEELTRAIAADSELRAKHKTLAAAWDDLEAPPARPAPPELRVQVMTRIRKTAEQDMAMGWRAAPRWARAAAAVALLVGAVSGAALTRLTATEPLAAEHYLVVDLMTLAESYVDDLEAERNPGSEEVTP